jgi:hypothetical protein
MRSNTNTGRAEPTTRWRRGSAGMDESRGHVFDRRSPHGDRETQDAPPPPPVAHEAGASAPVMSGWPGHPSHGAIFASQTTDDADASYEATRANTRPSGASSFLCTTRTHHGHDESVRTNGLYRTRDPPTRRDDFVGTSDEFEPFEDENEDVQSALLRGLARDRAVLQGEIKRIQHLDRQREEVLRLERHRATSVEKQLQTLTERGAGDGDGVSAGFAEQTRAAMRSALESVAAAARDRDDALVDVQTELGVLQMERMKLTTQVGRLMGSKQSRENSHASVGGDDTETRDVDIFRVETLAKELAFTKKSLQHAHDALAVESELRGDLETSARRLAEECSSFDVVEREARFEIAAVKSDVVRVTAELQREVSISKSALADTDAVNEILARAKRRCGELAAELERVRCAEKSTASDMVASAVAERDAAAKNARELRLKLDLQTQRSDSQAFDIEQLTHEKAALSIEIETMRMKLTDVSDESEQVCRDLFDAHETARRALRKEISSREDGERKHRLELVSLQDVVRRATRGGAVGVSRPGTVEFQRGSGADATGGDKAGTSAMAAALIADQRAHDASVERLNNSEIKARGTEGPSKRTTRNSHDAYDRGDEIPHTTETATPSGTGYSDAARLSRPQFAPNGLPLPSLTNPGIPPLSQYDKYLSSLSPSPVQEKKPPPPPPQNGAGSEPGSGEGTSFRNEADGKKSAFLANDAPRASWRERPQRPPQ